MNRFAPCKAAGTRTVGRSHRAPDAPPGACARLRGRRLVQETPRTVRRSHLARSFLSTRTSLSPLRPCRHVFRFSIDGRTRVEHRKGSAFNPSPLSPNVDLCPACGIADLSIPIISPATGPPAPSGSGSGNRVVVPVPRWILSPIDGIAAAAACPVNDEDRPSRSRPALRASERLRDPTSSRLRHDGAASGSSARAGRQRLSGCGHHVSYATKFDSAFYGFTGTRSERPALCSRGDKKTYYIQYANSAEGPAEIVGHSRKAPSRFHGPNRACYLDIIRLPQGILRPATFAYQVSGECSMIRAAAAIIWLDRRRCDDGIAVQSVPAPTAFILLQPVAEKLKIGSANDRRDSQTAIQAQEAGYDRHWRRNLAVCFASFLHSTTSVMAVTLSPQLPYVRQLQRQQPCQHRAVVGHRPMFPRYFFPYRRWFSRGAALATLRAQTDAGSSQLGIAVCMSLMGIGAGVNSILLRLLACRPVWPAAVHRARQSRYFMQTPKNGLAGAGRSLHRHHGRKSRGAAHLGLRAPDRHPHPLSCFPGAIFVRLNTTLFIQGRHRPKAAGRNKATHVISDKRPVCHWRPECC